MKIFLSQQLSLCCLLTKCLCIDQSIWFSPQTLNNGQMTFGERGREKGRSGVTCCCEMWFCWGNMALLWLWITAPVRPTHLFLAAQLPVTSRQPTHKHRHAFILTNRYTLFMHSILKWCNIQYAHTNTQTCPFLRFQTPSAEYDPVTQLEVWLQILWITLHQTHTCSHDITAYTDTQQWQHAVTQQFSHNYGSVLLLPLFGRHILVATVLVIGVLPLKESIQFAQKWRFCCHLLTLMLVQTYMTFCSPFYEISWTFCSISPFVFDARKSVIQVWNH